MEACGFEFRSCFIWVKPHLGLGNYWRVAHEFLLLGVRGKLPFLEQNARSWLELPQTAHSAKPEEIRGVSERASPAPRVELFARQSVTRWTSWGNEVRTQADGGSASSTDPMSVRVVKTYGVRKRRDTDLGGSMAVATTIPSDLSS